MTFDELQFLFIDCQTTGIRPPNAHLLEIAWALSAPTGEIEVQSHLVALPDGHRVPRLVTEMTGITEDHLKDAVHRDVVAEALRSHRTPVALIHYAQFERPFLTDLLGSVPFEIFCSFQLAKRLFPKLPSRNIRATAGFFGPAVVGHNRAATFVRATAQIWAGLKAELAVRGVTDLAGLREFLNAVPPKTRVKSKPSTGYEYRLDKVKRLELPDAPGVYRMLGANREVLYVGKATSLKDRVNSYFRGKKGRDQRKLEMLAQVWDLDTTKCGSPLEAALLESDEIKRLNPPYNVMLRTGRRHLVFYNRDFTDCAREQSEHFARGPFRNHNWIEHLRALARSLAADQPSSFEPIFFDPIPPTDVAAGFDVFCARHAVSKTRLATVRAQLALALTLYRAFTEPAADADEEPEDAATDSGVDHVLTPDEIADKFERLFRRAAREVHRGRRLTKLLSTRVFINDRTLTFARGRLILDPPSTEGEAVGEDPPSPWVGLGVDTFDRMSILLTALNKHAPVRSAGPRP